MRATHGMVTLITLVIIVMACILVASSRAGPRAEAAPAGDPAEVVLAQLQAKVDRHAAIVAKLRRHVRDLQDEVARLDRITHLWACTIRVWEDASARFRDPETEVNAACRDYIGEYVGGPWDSEDLS